MRRVEIAQHHIGIGDSGCVVAQAVADRAGVGAGAVRADLQRATAVDPHQRAAACTHFGQIDGGHFERVACARQQPRARHDAGADGLLLRAHDLTVLDHAGLGRGAAHVEADDLIEALGAGDLVGPDDAGCRSRLDDVHGTRRRCPIRRQAPIRLHEEQLRRHAERIEALAQRVQIGRDHRHDIGIDHRRRGALVFFDLG